MGGVDLEKVGRIEKESYLSSLIQQASFDDRPEVKTAREAKGSP